jgi:polysaccharide export outer membrane protein
MHHICRSFLLLGCAFALLAAGVRGADGPAPDAPRPASRDYLIQPGDIIRIQVFQEPDLDRELRVSQDGDLVFPLIGRVLARGRTLAQLEQTVREAYDRDYLVNPQVSVAVVKYRSRTVNVLGMVNQPQAVEYPPEQSLTLLDAVSRAGGFNRLADRKHVRVSRTFADGRVENYTVNADDLMAGGTKEPWLVQPEDVVFVPERLL